MRFLKRLWAYPGTFLGKLLAGDPEDWHENFEIEGVDFVELKAHTYGDNLLKALGKAGITLGHIVLLRRDRLTAERFAHEMVHVRQWETFGPFFLILYPLLFPIFESKAEKAERKARDIPLLD